MRQNDCFEDSTRLNRYEKTSALLTTLVLFVSILVFLMLFIWFFFQLSKRMVAEPTPLLNFLGIEEEKQKSFTGVSNDILPPGEQDFPEIEKNQIKERFQAISDLPSKLQAEFDRIEGMNDKDGIGFSLGKFGWKWRDPGPQSRPWERWSIEYGQTDFDSYIQIVDHFGIQIGLVSRNTQRIDLLSDASTQASSSTTVRNRENRVYLMHRQDTLHQWDRMLLRRAGIRDFEDRYSVQFIPDRLTARMIQLEKDFASRNNIKLKSVEQTIFRVQKNGDKFEIRVRSMK